MNLLLGVSGSIAAYKAPFIVRELRSAGHSVTCILTKAAEAFVSRFTLQNISENKCYTDTDFWHENNVHILLTRQSDGMIVAPCSANTLAKCASGRADNLLTNCFLASTGPKAIVPAMHTEMATNTLTLENMARCKEQGIGIWGPCSGALLSGHTGTGRMLDPATIAAFCATLHLEPLPLQHKHLVITAGGTTEQIDPVRCISNHASGQLGTHMADLATLNGATVRLITSKSASSQTHAHHTTYTSSSSLKAALEHTFSTQVTDGLIMAAAVSDFIPVYSATKIKRRTHGKTTLDFLANDDLLATLTKTHTIPCVLGFCLQNTLTNTCIPEKKRKEKGCTLLYANTAANLGSTHRSGILYSKDHPPQPLQDLSLFQTAHALLAACVPYL